MQHERFLSTRFNTTEFQDLGAYRKAGGYETAKKAITAMTPAQIIDVVKASNLRGLGGAGFPAGMKWSFIPKDNPNPRYLVVNADEGEPGTFKDRYLMVHDPHRLIEGMMIASFAIGAHKAYIYIRGEYIRPADILDKAIAQARAAGVLGPKCLGSDYALEIVVFRGAGAYICGEETALLESLEGKKGQPRLKPPFPAVIGLFNCPTVINNVETLCCVPYILERGADWFSKLGAEKNGGNRLFCLSGHVKRPGVYECSMRVTLRELIYEQAGGMREGRTLKAVIPGGISAAILTANEIDTQMDFDSLKKAGTMAGSGGVIIMDDSTNMVKALWNAMQFFSHESCGQCSPCREGTGWAFKVVSRMLNGQGHKNDIAALLHASRNMMGTTICAFGDAAGTPGVSYIQKFPKEFEERCTHA